MRQITLSLLIVSLLGLTVMAQQNVTIKPGDDVLAILETVVDPNSTITFDAGYYLVTPHADGTPTDFLTPPPGTTIRGAGSGMDPSTATIIDCAVTFDSAVKILEGFDGITVENMTLMRTFDEVIETDAGSFDITFNNIWGLKGGESVVGVIGEANFNFCVFGWSTDKECTIMTEEAGRAIFTNCDIFLGSNDLVEADGDSEMVFRNCILFAGPGDNDLNGSGFITVVASVGWDPTSDDQTQGLGGLDLAGAGVFIEDTAIGEDPLYVKPPGMGFSTKTMDLHLQEGSPALTAGSTSFDDDHRPTGDPTFVGSQGAAPVDVGDWSIY